MRGNKNYSYSSKKINPYKKNIVVILTENNDINQINQ